MSPTARTSTATRALLAAITDYTGLPVRRLARDLLLSAFFRPDDPTHGPLLEAAVARWEAGMAGTAVFAGTEQAQIRGRATVLYGWSDAPVAALPVTRFRIDERVEDREKRRAQWLALAAELRRLRVPEDLLTELAKFEPPSEASLRRALTTGKLLSVCTLTPLQKTQLYHVLDISPKSPARQAKIERRAQRQRDRHAGGQPGSAEGAATLRTGP